MDIRRIEQIEKEDHSEETLNLTKRWRELVKPESTEHQTELGRNITRQDITEQK